jgi:hypothetical protein
MPVFTPHKDYSAALADWQQIKHCLGGQRVIKEQRDKYLPKPNAADKSPENDARYEAYLLRSSFHNITGRTVENEVGQVFSVAPVPTMPDELLPLVDNINGDGVTAEQQAKEALGFIIAYSRAALLVDMPPAPSETISIKQAEDMGLRAKVVLYGPEDVINWKLEPVGARTRYKLVVIREEYATEASDEFTDKLETQYRVLRLMGGRYTVEIWRKQEGNDSNWGPVPTLTVQPVKAGNQPFDEIPFLFLGARENSAKVEKPLMLDISNVNLSHYRNSADYEEAVYMVGQPTPWAAGLSDAWVNDHLKGQFFIGSRALIPLPEGGAAGLLQAQANTLPKEAMDQKEAQMIALGAQVVDQAEVAKTATETSITASVDTAILAAAASNVTAGYSWAFRVCAEFQGVTVAKPEDDILYELNTDFAISRMPAPDRAELRNDYAAGLITFEEARSALRESGVAYLSDEEAKEEMEAKADEDLAKAKKEMAANTDEQIRLNEETAPEPAAAA